MPATKTKRQPQANNQTEYRLSRIESMINAEIRQREQQEIRELQIAAYKEGKADGKSASFWPHFAMGAAYACICIWLWKRKSGGGLLGW